MREKSNNLSECEEKVMLIIWSNEKEMNLAEIMQAVNERFHKEWKPQTVSTFLARMVKKNFLTSHRVGRYHYYNPVVTKKTYRRDKIKEFVKSFYDEEKEDAVKDIME